MPTTSRQPPAVSLIFGSCPVDHPDLLPGTCEPVRVADPLVSPLQCKVTRWSDSSMSVTDLGSFCPTYIRRRGATIYQRIPRNATRVLCPGDVVKIGSTEIPYGSVVAGPAYHYVP